MEEDYRLLGLIKQIAKDDYVASKPTEIRYGYVTEVEPINIILNSQMHLDKSMLVLTDNVRDYEVNVDIDGIPRTMKVYNGLKYGDRVILVRYDSGQKYLVVSRI